LQVGGKSHARRKTKWFGGGRRVTWGCNPTESVAKRRSKRRPKPKGKKVQNSDGLTRTTLRGKRTKERRKNTGEVGASGSSCKEKTEITRPKGMREVLWP